MTRPGLVLLFFLASLLPCAYAIASCYRRNGTEDTNIYVPCNSSGSTVSMCLRSQTFQGSVPDAQCLPNGLAQHVSTSTPPVYAYWRHSCTDQTWKSPYCLTAFDQCSEDVRCRCLRRDEALESKTNTEPRIMEMPKSPLVKIQIRRQSGEFLRSCDYKSPI
jgi:hypothetical protein